MVEFMPPSAVRHWHGLWIYCRHTYKQFKGFIIFWLEKLPCSIENEIGLLSEGGTKPLSKEQVRSLATLIKGIVAYFGLWKKVTKDSDMNMLLGMELVSLKGFNEFMRDYEKLSYTSNEVDDNEIKLNIITIIPYSILDKVHISCV